MKLLTPILMLAMTTSTVYAVTCLKVGSKAKATYINSEGKTCTYTAIVGNNFGTNEHFDDYGCLGRCGSGCTGASNGNVYTQDCFTLDICAYFNNAAFGDRFDPNCGGAYNATEDDFLLGVIDGCTGRNPKKPVRPPKTSPTCV